MANVASSRQPTNRPRRADRPGFVGNKYVGREMVPLWKASERPVRVFPGKEKPRARVRLTQEVGSWADLDESHLALSPQGKSHYLRMVQSRVLPAVIEAFGPQLSKAKRESTVRAVLKASSTPETTADLEDLGRAIGICMHSFFGARILVRSDFGMLKPRVVRAPDGKVIRRPDGKPRKTSPMARNEPPVHETMHALAGSGFFGRINENVAAKAVGTYFSCLERFQVMKKPGEIERRLEEAKAGLRNADPDKESDYFYFGDMLAAKAAILELREMWPGLGLFYIAEVCKGVAPEEAERMLLENPPSHFRKWQKKHGPYWFARFANEATAGKRAQTVAK
ncbi:MAG: hypothetical protein V1493_05840 [Candidatus Diapherotrites archaeon]